MQRRRKIIVYIATSADGYIARPDGDVEWLNRRPRTVDYGMREFYSTIDTVLWGRKTYDWVLRPNSLRGALMLLIGIDEQVDRTLDIGREAFEKRYRVFLGENLDLVRNVVRQTLALVASVPRDPRWGGFLAVDEETSTIIGTCGFKAGPSSEGDVEIAYFTFPQFEGRGYATAMARQLISSAAASKDVRRVIAHTLPHRSASTRVLEKSDMSWVGEVDDPEDGRVWRWVRRRGDGSVRSGD